MLDSGLGFCHERRKRATALAGSDCRTFVAEKSDTNVELHPPNLDSKFMCALRHLSGFTLFLSLAACQSTPEGASVVVIDQGDQASVAAMRADVEALTSEEFGGRETGQSGAYAAGEWVAGRMASFGWVEAGDSGFFQTFRYKPHPPIQLHGDKIKTMGMAVVREVVGKNVLAATELPSDSAKGWGVIGCHHDHLGWGDENSLWSAVADGDSAMHPGADDNASGVAIVLELASRHAVVPMTDAPLLLASFSGEEKGLWGSNHYTNEATVGLENIDWMINFDMVGHLRGDTLAVYGNGTSPVWDGILETCNGEERAGFELVLSESGVGPSDHTSFYLEDIPVLHFFTGQHQDYHKPSDTADKLNYEGMVRIADFAVCIVRELGGQDSIPFTKTKDSSNDDMPRFKVTLGVVPDYLFSGTGMRIDGVSEDRPAANAGMKKGDIVVRMDDHEVNDMMGYMEGLAMFEEGQVTLVEVRRGEETIVLNVTWD